MKHLKLILLSLAIFTSGCVPLNATIVSVESSREYFITENDDFFSKEIQEGFRKDWERKAEAQIIVRYSSRRKKMIIPMLQPEIIPCNFSKVFRAPASVVVRGRNAKKGDRYSVSGQVLTAGFSKAALSTLVDFSADSSGLWQIKPEFKKHGLCFRVIDPSGVMIIGVSKEFRIDHLMPNPL